MGLRVRFRGFALVCLLSGCGDDGSSGEGGSTGPEPAGSSTGTPMNTAPVVMAMQADVAVACTREGATRVELHATRVGCVNPPPAPCTIAPRPTVGEGVDCPPDDSPVDLGVELTQAGRYEVEVVTLAGEDELFASCWGEDGGTEMFVDDERFAANPTIEVTLVEQSPCE